MNSQASLWFPPRHETLIIDISSDAGHISLTRLCGISRFLHVYSKANDMFKVQNSSLLNVFLIYYQAWI